MSKSRFQPEYLLLLRKLIQARHSAGVSQEHIAKALGKVQSHVSKIESLDREISITDARIYCLVVGLKLSDVIAGWEEEIKTQLEP